MENKAAIAATAVAVLALMGGVVAWIYSHLESVSVLETREATRYEWLERYLKSEELRFQDLTKRIERLENKPNCNCNDIERLRTLQRDRN